MKGPRQERYHTIIIYLFLIHTYYYLFNYTRGMLWRVGNGYLGGGTLISTDILNFAFTTSSSSSSSDLCISLCVYLCLCVGAFGLESHCYQLIWKYHLRETGRQTISFLFSLSFFVYIGGDLVVQVPCKIILTKTSEPKPLSFYLTKLHQTHIFFRPSNSCIWYLKTCFAYFHFLLYNCSKMFHFSLFVGLCRTSLTYLRVDSNCNFTPTLS